MEDRATTLLTAAKELLSKQKEAGILIDHPITVHYDDADCDGYCLIDDITAEIEAPEEKPHGVSVQEHIDLEHKLKEIRKKEKQLYDKLRAWKSNLGNLQNSVSSDNPGHCPNPAEDTKIMHYTTTGDYILTGVLKLCEELLELEVVQPIKVSEPKFNEFREYCPKCGYSHRVTVATLSKECPICHNRLQEVDL